ncbi:hypothetical protein [Vacuolonema iberomarrocanum]|uniref:hypothetical protein n=1 Tax=Vacuolonema iberomarrocanum TaxID=3454632 RepID=UPI0019E4352B|nr:hypothetical protein [filamentous cyanobacterium LEGE 07170]
MDSTKPRKVYHNLRLLDHVNTATGAMYRQMAQEILADPEVDLVWRQAIAHRLSDANMMLEHQTVGGDDSY